ncbi:UvrD-helicase domain-containing protein [Xylanibacter muris]|uniref:DNA 3'-5' helicase n=1 Tax=Xylanibacter muris TaxID=2736290 RepID=A0ABX2ANI2_9BACT|nr:UvrD-helicase domain-containing protein [Xylanibacter muris]NPD92749.1 UvrD-helicase domain-containing protein [Xylanibacter muris]
MNKSLKVYKASAGSGKTFTLAIEYIKLLIKNPQNYRNILAVTFTNKATEEMKHRILSQLYGLWKNLDDSKDYMEVLTGDLQLTQQFISSRAGTALYLLLHNYSFFRVETIDSFFQSVLRNLAHELDLTPNLRIDLNDGQVADQAVDTLIESLDENSNVLHWIMQYINANIEDDKSWNVINNIKVFGKTIFEEFYKQNSEELSGKLEKSRFFENYMARLQSEKKSAKAVMKEFADEFFKRIEDNGLTVDDFSNRKSGVAGLFIKLRKGIFDNSIIGTRVTACLDSPEKWYTAKSPNKQIIHELALQYLIPLLNHAVSQQPEQWNRYLSSDITLKHLNQLRLLNKIEQTVRVLNDNANRFLLSDTQYLLHSLIKDNDSPFIFEKIGTRIENVMIDEFQDTSLTQWKNFKVLLLECMSHDGSENLIVGDVKQSIYRWRSGDWRLLNNIGNEFASPVKEQLDIRPLETNYRSDRNIIAFNNVFFSVASYREYTCHSDTEDDEIKNVSRQFLHAYEDVVQKVPEKKGDCGYVNIKLLPKQEYEGNMLSVLEDTVVSLLKSNVPMNDIAILVRNNKQIPVIANYFMEHGNIRIVSDEAFRLDASSTVNILISALYLLTHPDDIIVKTSLAVAYQRLIVHNTQPISNILLKNTDIDRLLPDKFINNTEQLASEPLYDLVEQLYGLFSLGEIHGQSAYVFAFYDQLRCFINDNIADINTFITEWKNKICSKTIQCNEIDGIRIISIHKSKGLEYKTVIIPFCNWTLEHTRNNIIWCSPETEPYNAIPLVPVDYSSRLLDTAYKSHYSNEHIQNGVDNLNLLYVAFTRARNNLYVIGQKGADINHRSNMIEKCLGEVSDKLEGSLIEGNNDDDTVVSFSFGRKPEYANKDATQESNNKTSENVFMKDSETEFVDIEYFENKPQFRQSNKSREFTSEDEDTQQKGYIKMGNILHKVFSSIKTSDDIKGIIDRMHFEGLLFNDEITQEKLELILNKSFANKQIAEWFSNKWTVFNECSVVTYDEMTHSVKERRPDRVITDGNEMIVIDFKFGRKRDSYIKQVAEYMTLLVSMGYKNVKGFLWFVYQNQVDEVHI